MEQISYVYDANGQRTLKSSASGTLQDTTFAATYDAANRMTSITLHPNTASAKSYLLSYDDHGNLVQKQNANVPGEMTLYRAEESSARSARAPRSSEPNTFTTASRR
jgi:YD repeat-containing protein